MRNIISFVVALIFASAASYAQNEPDAPGGSDTIVLLLAIIAFIVVLAFIYLLVMKILENRRRKQLKREKNTERREFLDGKERELAREQYDELKETIKKREETIELLASKKENKAQAEQHITKYKNDIKELKEKLSKLEKNNPFLTGVLLSPEANEEKKPTRKKEETNALKEIIDETQTDEKPLHAKGQIEKEIEKLSNMVSQGKTKTDVKLYLLRHDYTELEREMIMNKVFEAEKHEEVEKPVEGSEQTEILREDLKKQLLELK